MGSNFHNVHVRSDPEGVSAITEAVLAHFERSGYERVPRARDADRVVRVSKPKGGWVSIVDEGWDAAGVARSVARSTRLPVLEAYCEASAIVWLRLYSEGRVAGGWGNAKPPPRRVLAPLLKHGTARELREAWEDGARQVFPENALAEAARRFGLDVGRVFEEVQPRGETLALRVRTRTWTPVYRGGPPELYVDLSSNGALDRRHLVFVNRDVSLRGSLRSLGGSTTGLSVTLGGDAIENGLLVPKELSLEHSVSRQVVRAPVIDRVAHFPELSIPAALVDPPDAFHAPSPRESDRLRELTEAGTWWFDLHAHAASEGVGALAISACPSDGAPHARFELPVYVAFRPVVPRHVAPHADDHALFAMHLRSTRFVSISFRVAVDEAWAYVRPRLEAWTERLRVGGYLDPRSPCVLLHDDRVLVNDALIDAWPKIVAQLLSPDGSPWVRLDGPGFAFGHPHHRPWRPVDDAPAVAWELAAPMDEPLDVVRAVADEAMRDGIACGALAAEWSHRPRLGETSWESVTMGGGQVLGFRAWHETRVRGLDRCGVWLGREHLARIDRAALPAHVVRTELGDGLRLTLDEQSTRTELAPLEEALAAILPSKEAADTWEQERR